MNIYKKSYLRIAYDTLGIGGFLSLKITKRIIDKLIPSENANPSDKAMSRLVGRAIGHINVLPIMFINRGILCWLALISVVGISHYVKFSDTTALGIVIINFCLFFYSLITLRKLEYNTDKLKGFSLLNKELSISPPELYQVFLREENLLSIGFAENEIKRIGYLEQISNLSQGFVDYKFSQEDTDLLNKSRRSNYHVGLLKNNASDLWRNLSDLGMGKNHETV